MQLIDEPMLGAVCLAPPLGRRFEAVERQGQALGCGVDCASLCHRRYTHSSPPGTH
jgi:hypothetical protein